MQRTAKKCTKSYNARAQLLFCSLNLLFSDVPVAVAVVVILNSLLRRGGQVDSIGIDLPDDQHIGEIGEEGYKYLGILQLDQNLNTKMKVKITSEYIRRVKKLCRSKLNGGNLIGGINTWAVGVVRYSAEVVDWTMEEMTSMDRRTRKILAMKEESGDDIEVNGRA